MAGARGDVHRFARLGDVPPAPGEELGLSLEHLEALLHGRVDMRRNSASWIDPSLDVKYIVAGLGRTPKAAAHPQDWVLRQLGAPLADGHHHCLRSHA
jgi:hypothetical protein